MLHSGVTAKLKINQMVILMLGSVDHLQTVQHGLQLAPSGDIVRSQAVEQVEQVEEVELEVVQGEEGTTFSQVEIK